MVKTVKKSERQLVLQAWKTVEEVNFSWITHATEFHTVRIKNTEVENFLNKIGRKGKDGEDRISEGAQHLKLCDWLMRKAKPKIPKMTGDDWEASMRTLLSKIFGEKWDKYDPDEEAQNVKEFVAATRKSEAVTEE